jgi:hypothetical protein
VYSDWKGIKYTRQHVIPANPQTALQQAQRAFVTAGVGLWHTDMLIAYDKSAWDLLASRVVPALSGFNAYIREYIRIRRLPKTWLRLYELDCTSIDAQGGLFHVGEKTGDATLTAVLYLGTSMGYLPYHTTLEWNGSTLRYEHHVTDLQPGTIYYYWVGAVKTGNEGRTGIRKFTTLVS